jgi:hypothetical protein
VQNSSFRRAYSPFNMDRPQPANTGWGPQASLGGLGPRGGARYGEAETIARVSLYRIVHSLDLPKRFHLRLKSGLCLPSKMRDRAAEVQ